MQLVLDIGNSRIKWGLRNHGQWHGTGTLPTTSWSMLSSLLREHQPLTRVLATLVASAEVAAGVEACCAKMAVPLQWIHAETAAGGVVNHYGSPQQLGSDRWAALIGAHALTDQPAVVVCAGTATTVDALSAEGAFLGGIILPGLSLMTEALRTGTAGLSAGADGRFTAFPGSTADAMATGRILATVGAIERLGRTLQARQTAPVVCVLSGGHGPLLATHLDLPVVAVEYLVLEGLARLMPD
ncbi:MAG: type III pantothenate kinase [Burkholderiales bacterium]